MCQLKSAIVLKDRVYCPEHDHHTKMLEELKIEDSTKNAESVFVRVELVPPSGDVFSDIDTWEIVVDQDIKPDWFFAEVEKPKLVEAVKAWAKEHIFVGVDDLNITVSGNETQTIYLKDCQNANVKSWDTSTANVESWGTSTANVESWGTSTANVEIYDTSTANVKSCHTSTANVESYGTSTANVKSCDTSTANVESWGTSTANVEIYGTSTANVESCDTSTAHKLYSGSETTFVFSVCDNATFKDHVAKEIHQSGDWKVVMVAGENQ